MVSHKFSGKAILITRNAHYEQFSRRNKYAALDRSATMTGPEQILQVVCNFKKVGKTKKTLPATYECANSKLEQHIKQIVSRRWIILTICKIMLSRQTQS